MKPSNIQVYTDQSGNRHVKGMPYKSRSTALLFDPFIMRKAKASFGSQYKDRNNRWAWGKAKIGYRAKQQSDKIFDSVGNFILSYKDQNKRLDLFKNALQTKIIGAKQTTGDYNIQQLAEYFPWMMSCNLLFDPLRQYIYCLSHKVDPKNAHFVQQTLPPQMINTEVNKAIYQCVKVNGSLLQNAKAIYQRNNIGVLIKGFRVLLQGSKQFQGFMKQVLSNTGSAIYRTISSMIPQVVSDAWDKTKDAYNYLRNFFSSERTSQQNVFSDANMKNNFLTPQQGAVKFFDQLIDQVFRQLRIYGEIVISYGYLRHSAQRKFVNGKMLYYYLDRPNLLFSIQNSFPSVYQMDQNNVVSLIPPGNFNMSFLRKLVANQVVSLGGRMLKTIKDDISKPDDQIIPFKRFQKKYLNWDQDVPAVDKYAYNNLTKDTVIRKQIMDANKAQNLIYAYGQNNQIPNIQNYAPKKKRKIQIQEQGPSQYQIMQSIQERNRQESFRQRGINKQRGNKWNVSGMQLNPALKRSNFQQFNKYDLFDETPMPQPNQQMKTTNQAQSYNPFQQFQASMNLPRPQPQKSNIMDLPIQRQPQRSNLTVRRNYSVQDLWGPVLLRNQI